MDNGYRVIYFRLGLMAYFVMNVRGFSSHYQLVKKYYYKEAI